MCYVKLILRISAAAAPTAASTPTAWGVGRGWRGWWAGGGGKGGSAGGGSVFVYHCPGYWSDGDLSERLKLFGNVLSAVIAKDKV